MPEPPEMKIDETKTYRVTIDSSKGPFAMDLMPSLAPVTVNNFVSLARQGYYDGLTFHRYVEGFVIQGGDPTGTGSGGPGDKFADQPGMAGYPEGAVTTAHPRPHNHR